MKRQTFRVDSAGFDPLCSQDYAWYELRKSAHRHPAMLPNLNLKLQFVAKLLPDTLAYAIDELEHVGGLGAGMGDDEVPVPVGDFGPAKPRAFQSRLIDESAGGDIGRWVLEDAA